MGLTIANWGNVSTNMARPNHGIASEDWAALGRGLGGLQKWSQRQKAADMMEGRATAQYRIKAIDDEIASLEAKLQGYEEQARADAQAAENRAVQQQNMEGYSPLPQGPQGSQDASPYPQVTSDVYQDQYLAAQAARAGQPNRSVQTYNPGLRDTRENIYTASQADRALQLQGKYRWGR